MLQRIIRGLELTLVLVILASVTGYSNPSLTDKLEKIRAYTRQIEFNYLSWMGSAAMLKLRSASIGVPYTIEHGAQKQIVTEYLRTTQSILEKEYLLEQLYADAAIIDKDLATEPTRSELEKLYARQTELAPFAESILQDQVSQILTELGLTAIGQPVPNVWYHATPLPLALIVSPRDRIEQTANVSLETDLTVDEQVALEDRVDQGLNTSSLVVHIGGVGVYPTMVMRSTDMNWVLNTIAHEWIHNYLTLRPLGFFYNGSPELRTMNETTASIAGNEIGGLVIERFYPELIRASHPPLSLISAPFDHPEPGDFLRPPFDFRAEMNKTRVTADTLLAEGKIEEAEAYMESRRLVFLKNGYLLRKINQAYFAFHGAYADTPGGAAGQDPVGPAVRALREQSESLADFVNTISWMTDFEQLQEEINQ
ncbi:MAG: hypothetical protein H7Y59_16430 [Anaerolineales bacterium]|nr:hypothetical protein [Anaerolineales bacterium]